MSNLFALATLLPARRRLVAGFGAVALCATLVAAPGVAQDPAHAAEAAAQAAAQATEAAARAAAQAAEAAAQAATAAVEQAGDAAAAATDLDAARDEKALYALGVMMWRNLQGFDLSEAELAMVQSGLAAAAAGEAADLDLQQAGAEIEALRRTRTERRAATEKERGAAYLEQQAAREGAVRGDSGWLYIETTAGEGEAPTAADTVKVHYRGTLVDGTEFDSSYERGQPAEFPLGRVIKCWTEGLQKMKPGGKATLICPSDVAYGDRGRPSIPAGATLVFDIELLEVRKAGTPAEKPAN